MASFVQTVSSMSKVAEIFDEIQWVIQIRRTLEEELEDEIEMPVSIFSVPKVLMSSNPDLYMPQQVAIGPYYHWHPETYEMERYKLAAAKRSQKQLQGIEFHNLVEQLQVKLESRVRACYHKYLDFNGETLAWMMAIDGSFLLEFLQVYAIKEGKMPSRVSSRMSHLVDYAGTKSAHNTILRDIVMLENQIPLFILRKMLEFQFASLEEADDILLVMLTGFYKEVSPFKLMEALPKTQAPVRAHLLDFLYDTIVPKVKEQPETIEEEGNNEDKEGKARSAWSFLSSSGADYIKQLSDQIWKSLFKLKNGNFKWLLLLKPVKVLLKLPWAILSKLPFFSVLAQPLEYLVSSQVKEEGKSENENSNPHKPPSVEEITIPSVSDLSNAGVRFVATKGSLSSIAFDAFDAKMVTLYLPAISLDVNSEAIMRNLVAYEASNTSGPLVFTRYTELMNGIIDSDEDVKLLREKGVILNRLKSDDEVAKLWNGMSKSIRLTKVPFLDKAIEDVNKYYNGRWKVKLGRSMKLYVLGSWQFLALLAGIVLLVLMTLHSFCSVYGCSRIVHIKATAFDQS